MDKPIDRDFCFDEARYFGDPQDGVYVEVGPNDGKPGFYCWTVVDSETGHFIQDLDYCDEFSTEPEAQQYGEFAAINWCLDNGIEWQEREARP
jgi:hypothetical protein